jgi:SAM-dependent methyltransferase
MPEHRALILDQFTRQAVPFSTSPGIRDEEALQRLVEASGAGPADTVLDVACGPGLVVAAFARVARHVTGIDLTPAMIERARALAGERRLANVTLSVGDARPLPYSDAAFSVVVSRFAFHHFLEPAAVLAEMVRVCRPGGRVVVADAAVSPDPARAAAFNRMEKLRDPSHVRARPLAELTALFFGAGLPAPAVTRCEVRAEVEGLLSRSFPNPGDADAIRAMFVDSLPDDGLGVGARRHEGAIHFAYPVAILVAARP